MPLKTSHDELPVLNLTAMIDVLFLLIIFFVVGTKFVDDEQAIPLKVPQVTSQGAMTAAPQKKIVNVFQDGKVTLDQKTVTLEELTQRLTYARRQYKSLGVLVRGDGTGQFQKVAQVLSACKKAGIADLGIAVRVAESESTHGRRR